MLEGLELLLRNASLIDAEENPSHVLVNPDNGGQKAVLASVVRGECQSLSIVGTDNLLESFFSDPLIATIVRQSEPRIGFKLSGFIDVNPQMETPLLNRFHQIDPASAVPPPEPHGGGGDFRHLAHRLAPQQKIFRPIEKNHEKNRTEENGENKPQPDKT